MKVLIVCYLERLRGKDVHGVKIDREMFELLNHIPYKKTAFSIFSWMFIAFDLFGTINIIYKIRVKL